ncbi:M48 family metallopeptidase [Thiobacter aerophilum]|uniref:SprT family zinc-dependent metalloprotease n=1 Tax=Thiobacter aerophilum TaxID=3121275 RepID=A0ABV0EGY8_9BURK
MGYPQQETRVLALPDRQLSYTLLRRRRRTIGLKVDEDGLTVSAPPREPYRHLERVLLMRRDWIVEKLAQMEARRLPPRQWKSGERLLFLGENLELYLYRTHTRAEPIRTASRLLMGVHDPADADQVMTQVRTWYRDQAQRYFAQRLVVLAARLPVTPPPFRLSEARTSWGVCTPEGRLRLSWRLIQAPCGQIDYVVAHELAHLRHMNHSRAFWQTVAAIFPDYRLERLALERDGHLYHTF